jgi:hypothetical protein
MAHCGARNRKAVGDLISDRAKRYRANSPECKPRGPKICEYCGSRKNIDIHHRDGNENNGARRNLAYACRSCNLSIAAAMRKRGKGVPVSQTNPEGASSMAQWVAAVTSMRGLSNDIPKADAIEIIHATPFSDRSKYAHEIARIRKRRGNPAELLIFGNPSNPRGPNPAELILFGNPKRGKKNPRWVHTAGRSEVYRVIESQGRPPRFLLEGPYPSKARVWTASGRVYPAADPTRGANPHIEIDFDNAVKKFRAYMYDPKFGNLYSTGHTKKAAANALHQQVRDLRAGRRSHNPSAEYNRALDASRAASAEFRKVTLAYRARTIGDNEFLTARKKHDAAQKVFDAAFAKEQARGQNPRSKTTPKKRTTGSGEGRKRRTLPSRRNPSDTKEAVKLFGTFHGRDATQIVEKQESAAIRLDYTALGDLDYIKIRTPQDEYAQVDFEGDGVKLASSPDGKQLYCIGGNQNLAGVLDADSLQKDFIDLGEAREVQYVARKVHSDPPFEPVSWFHKFGEKGGALPRLMYDKLRKRIFFIGGEYFIDTKAGISPGIEG